ncbi:Fis family transcriptional regulator [Mycobacteroides chelonae]|uniref:Fis family transcriptional regulator n=1 Tax=Mycobacteroides chelonae TaxID=1774 RepID=UPI0008A85450|nr:Fis family transcriptional regulator [Mycobacteroides chelonae]OHT81887.1 Fis family transcriptional regulator [Mycobacteroides chelonae]
MARPRKPEDPHRYPVPCARCKKHYYLVKRWPDGVVCEYCYVAAKRIQGICGCGHKGILPGVINNNPACRRCSGVDLNLDCVECGAEAELYSGGCCQRCVLVATARRLLSNPETGILSTELERIVIALGAMTRPNSGLTWIRQKHVDEALRQIAAHPELTHEVFDQLPKGRTTNYLRALLVEHDLLPARSERIVRFTDWARESLQRVDAEEHRKLLSQYARWGLERHLRGKDTVSESAFMAAKQVLTVTIDFCNWLTTEHNVTVEQADQSHIDLWLSEGAVTRQRLDRFIRWAVKSRLVDPVLRVPPHRRGTAPRLSAADQSLVIDTVVHQSTLTPRDRLAAILVIVFGQRVETIAALTWGQILITDTVTIKLADLPIELTAPLDEPVRQLAADPSNSQTAAHRDSPWIFRGLTPGSHIGPTALRQRLKPTLSALQARLGTLNQLTQTTPIAILAETLGYSPITLEAHAQASGATYAQYIANKAAPSASEGPAQGELW